MAQCCFVVKCDLKGVDINSSNNIDCNSPRNGSVLFVFLVNHLHQTIIQLTSSRQGSQ